MNLAKALQKVAHAWDRRQAVDDSAAPRRWAGRMEHSPALLLILTDIRLSSLAAVSAGWKLSPVLRGRLRPDRLCADQVGAQYPRSLSHLHYQKPVDRCGLYAQPPQKGTEGRRHRRRHRAALGAKGTESLHQQPHGGRHRRRRRRQFGASAPRSGRAASRRSAQQYRRARRRRKPDDAVVPVSLQERRSRRTRLRQPVHQRALRRHRQPRKRA